MNKTILISLFFLSCNNQTVITEGRDVWISYSSDFWKHTNNSWINEYKGDIATNGKVSNDGLVYYTVKDLFDFEAINGDIALHENKIYYRSPGSNTKQLFFDNNAVPRSSWKVQLNDSIKLGIFCMGHFCSTQDSVRLSAYELSYYKHQKRMEHMLTHRVFLTEKDILFEKIIGQLSYALLIDYKNKKIIKSDKEHKENVLNYCE